MEFIKTNAAPGAVGPYSQAVAHGELLFCSGQIPLDPATNVLLEADSATQAALVLKNLRGLLEAGGSSMDRVVKTTMFLVSMDDFQAVNAVYAAAFGEHRPARSTIEVSRLPKGARVEIEAIAIRSVPA